MTSARRTVPPRNTRRQGADAGAAPKRVIDMGPLPGLIGYMLRRAQIAVFQDFGRAFAPYNIRPAHYAVLTIIERNPGLKQTEVGSALNIKRANFVSMCDELEERGLVIRRQIPADRRSYALHLTPGGASLMEQLRAVNAAHEEKLAAEIGEDGRRQMIELLTRLAALGDAEPAEDD
jgi:DNA-binding MarR family transcriptional regulator